MLLSQQNINQRRRRNHLDRGRYSGHIGTQGGIKYGSNNDVSRNRRNKGPRQKRVDKKDIRVEKKIAKQ